MSDNIAGPDRKTPVGVDPSRASIARVYDAFLDGKDNYQIDRDVMNAAIKVAPEARDLGRENRAFLIRACRFLAGRAGMSQFLDCGSGLPTAENTHQVVQRINREARIVYVDNDPVVLAHGRALLAQDERTVLVSADIFEPPEVLEHKIVRRYIDLNKPVALLQAGTLHHHSGRREAAAAVMRQYVDALPSGSYVVISHFFDPEDEDSEVARRLEDTFLHSPMGSGVFHTRAELLDLFAGLELVEPGLVRCCEWWPEGPLVGPMNVAQRTIAGAIGRKP